MLIGIPAGAIADLHDRRIVVLCSLVIALAATTTLATLAWMGLLTPNLLLALCSAAGTGAAMWVPAWQAAVSEQAPTQALPAAIAFNGISFNIVPSVGSAIGGIIVAPAGTFAAFALNAVSYVPLIGALYLWKRAAERSRLPPERLNRAVLLGVRYIANSPPIMVVLIRTTIRLDQRGHPGSLAAGGPRCAARQRTNIQSHAWSLWCGSCHRSGKYRNGAQALER